MIHSIIARYGELFLKGKNQSFFEKKLVENIQILTGIKEVARVRGRLVMGYFPEHQKLRSVFGLTSYSPALKVEKDLPQIQQSALSLLQGKEGTFKIESQRADKQFPFTSTQINILVGKFIEENTPLVFDFKNPQTALGIEINHDGAYLFTKRIGCCGGVPTGIEGKVFLLMEDEASFLAGILLMKRGCAIIPISLKKKNDLSLLQRFSPEKLELKTVSHFEKIENIAEKLKITTLISAQTIQNFKSYKSNLTIFHPLISYSTFEIKEKLRAYSI